LTDAEDTFEFEDLLDLATRYDAEPDLDATHDDGVEDRDEDVKEDGAPDVTAAEPAVALVDPARARTWPMQPRTVVHLLLAAVLSLWVGIFTVWVAYPTCPARTTLKPVPELADCYRLNGDALYFDTQARLLSEGKGFANPAAWNLASYAGSSGTLKPGAGHPPGYTVFLASLNVMGFDSVNSHRLIEVYVGAIGVFLIGVAGFRLGRERGHITGPIAAVLAATYPMIWINNFRYLSESIYVPIVALLILAAYGFWAKPTWKTAARYGAMIGVAGLVRGEGIFILAFTLPPLLWGMRSQGWKVPLKHGALVAALSIGMIVPWVLYNLSRFEAEPVLITSGTGSVLMYGSCDETFYGPAAGYYSFKCADDRPPVVAPTPQGQVPEHPGEDEFDLAARQTATEYLNAHRSRLPAVFAIRVGRLWDVYAPFQNAAFNDVAEGRGRLPSLVGLWYYWALLPFAALGGFKLVKRGIALSPIVGLAAGVTLTAMMSFGVTRYRVPADVGLVIIAAVGVDAFIVWFGERRHKIADARAHAPFVMSDEQFDAFLARLDEDRLVSHAADPVGAGASSGSRRTAVVGGAGGRSGARSTASAEPVEHTSDLTPHARVTKIVRLLLVRDDLTVTDLATGLTLDLEVVTRSMEGTRPWTVEELYALAWFFREPVTIFHDDPAELFEVFRTEV
jgi:hypothetical protein